MPATPAWPPRSAPRLFIAEELAADRTIAIEGNQAHYLSRVMRVGEGDAIILCDDITGEWAARIESVGKRRIEVAAIERLREKEAVPDFWLCPALVKKDRFDLILEKATELGVARIRPVVTRRCVVDKLNAERARTVTVEAAEQCARTALPIVDAPDKLDTLLRDWPQDRALFRRRDRRRTRIGGLRPSERTLCPADRPRRRLRRGGTRGYPRPAASGPDRIGAAHPARRDGGDRGHGAVDGGGGGLG